MNLFKIYSSNRLPVGIELRALMQCFDVHYMPTVDVPSCRLIENANQQLTVLGKPKAAVVLSALTEWLVKKARAHLSIWLHRLSLENNLAFTGLSIRQQRTLWGSCTAAKRINLNCKLLFLPPDLTEHILLHELCHTQHFNHSRAFWSLLSALDPQCSLHRHQLKTAQQFVPSWLKMG
jgi:predicted metal-dependent hydrolase